MSEKTNSPNSSTTPNPTARHDHFHHVQLGNGEHSVVGRRITWISVAVNIVLTTVQMVIGISPIREV